MIPCCLLQAIAEALLENKTLTSLNLETNYISGAGVIALMEAINVNQTVTALHVANQVQGLLREGGWGERG